MPMTPTTGYCGPGPARTFRSDVAVTAVWANAAPDMRKRPATVGARIFFIVVSLFAPRRQNGDDWRSFHRGPGGRRSGDDAARPRFPVHRRHMDDQPVAAAILGGIERDIR